MGIFRGIGGKGVLAFEDLCDFFNIVEETSEALSGESFPANVRLKSLPFAILEAFPSAPRIA